MLKKMMNKVFGFAMAGIFAGAFYREFTKFIGYSGETALSIVHTHTFALGAFITFFVVLFVKSFDLQNDKDLEKRYNRYFYSALGVIGTMIIRGFVDVFSGLGTLELTKGLDASISGIAAITHIAITITMFMLFNSMRHKVSDNK